MTVEAEVRNFIRAQDSVMSLLNDDATRVNMEWKGNASATHVVLYQAGGGMDDYVPLHSPVIVLHVYGSTRPAAADLSEAIALCLRGITNADKPLQSCSIESVIWLPTPDGVARYVVTAVVTAQLALVV